jgi:integrase
MSQVAMQKGEVKKTSFAESASATKTAPSAKKLSSATAGVVEDALMYLNAEITKKHYRRRLEMFFEFAGLEGANLDEKGLAFIKQAREGLDESWAQQQIMCWLHYQKERVNRKELSANTLRNFYKPIKFFCSFYRDIQNNIDWHRIVRSLPRSRQWSNDRAPTIEEIRKLCEYPDRRIKPLVYVMCSSGIRVGAWDYLKWKHVTPIKDEKTGEIKAAKLKVYAGDSEEYETFCTPESYHALTEWMDFRASYGEEITGDSWVMRDIWRTTDVQKWKTTKEGTTIRATKNYNFYAPTAANPQKLPVDSIKRIILRAIREQGLRAELQDGNRRFEWKQVHGFRKWFKTRAEQVILRSNVELLLSHSGYGMSQTSYYRPSEYELLTSYLRAIPLLTINNQDVGALKEQQQALEKENEDTKQALQRLEEQQKDMRKMILDLTRAGADTAMYYAVELKRVKTGDKAAKLTAREAAAVLGLEGDFEDKKDKIV